MTHRHLGDIVVSRIKALLEGIRPCVNFTQAEVYETNSDKPEKFGPQNEESKRVANESATLLLS